MRERGLEIRSPVLGDFTVRARAEEDRAAVGPVDVVIVAVKAYNNASALPLIAPMIGPDTTILPLQNGVDSAAELAAQFGEAPVVGGVTYIATALAAPGVIEQTGTHRRIVFGEVFGALPRLSARVSAIRDALSGADIQAEASRMAGCRSGRSSSFSSRWRALPARRGCRSARSGPIPLSANGFSTVAAKSSCSPGQKACRWRRYRGTHLLVRRGIPGSMRSSLLINLSQGKRIEVEQLQGSVVRRAARAGVPAPITSTLMRC